MTGNVYRQGDDGSGDTLSVDQLRSIVQAALVVAASEMPDRPCSRGRFLTRATDIVADAVRRELWPTDDEREFDQEMARTSLGCPNSPNCGRMLVEHHQDGWDSDGLPINPRCPEDS